MPVAVAGEARLYQPLLYLGRPHANLAFGFEAGAQLDEIDPDIQAIHASISASLLTVATRCYAKLSGFLAIVWVRWSARLVPNAAAIAHPSSGTNLHACSTRDRG